MASRSHIQFLPPFVLGLALGATCETAVAETALCGTLPMAGVEPSMDSVGGRWETCKADLAPGCAFGAFYIEFWREACFSEHGEDFDILVRMTWLEGMPLLPGQKDANGDSAGLCYQWLVPNWSVSGEGALTLSSGRTTADLLESETAGPFSFVGLLDRTPAVSVGQLLGSASWKFSPNSYNACQPSGVTGVRNAQPILLSAHFVHRDSFETP